MASPRKVPSSENISSFGGSGQGRDYTSVATWESDKDTDLVTATAGETLECYADQKFTISSTVTFAGATVDSSYWRCIRSATGEHTKGIPSSDGTVNVLFEVGSVNGFDLDEDYLQLQDVTMTMVANSSSNLGIVRFRSKDEVAAVGVLIRDGANSGSGGSRGFAGGYTNNVTEHIIACLIHNVDKSGILDGSGTGHITNILNTTIEGCGQDNITGSGNALCKNVACDNGGSSDFGGTYHASCTNNASSDATAPGSNARTGKTFTYVDSANDDFHLASQDTAAKGHGTDLSADANYAFDLDVDEATISSTYWPIGMDYVAASSGSPRLVPTSEAVSSFGGSGQGRDYTSIATWESDTDTDRVTGAAGATLECYADQLHAISAVVTMAGATVNAMYWRCIRSATDNHTKGIPSSDGTVDVLFDGTNNNNNMFDLQENYFQIQDVTMTMTINGSSNLQPIKFSDADEQACVGVLLRDGANSGSGVVRGFNCAIGANKTDHIIDCMIHNMDNVGIQGASNASGVIHNIINTTIEGCGSHGIVDIYGSETLCKNVLSDNNGGSDFSGTFHGSSTNNASSDTTAPGGSSRTSQTFSYVDSGSNDFHLDFDNDTGAKGHGADLSADSNYAFDRDVDDETISDWPIGFDEPIDALKFPPIFQRRQYAVYRR